MNEFRLLHRIGNAFITCSTDVNEFKNVIVSRHGIVLDENFRRVPKANQQFNFWSTMWAAWWEPARDLPDDMTEIPLRPTIELLDDNYIYALFYQDKIAFGHFWDILQSLYSVQNKGLSGTLLCHHQTDVVDLDFHWTAFGYPHQQRIAIDTTKYNYFVPTLYVPDLIIPPAQLHPELTPWLISKYNKAVSPEPDIMSRRLYLSRSKAGRRKIRNEPDLLPILERYAFTILHGDEGMQTHIKYFKTATVIVGALGSLFRNILFCTKKPKILEYCCNVYYDDHTIEQLSSHVGITDYRRAVVPDVGDGDIVVDPQEFEKALIDLGLEIVD